MCNHSNSNKNSKKRSCLFFKLDRKVPLFNQKNKLRNISIGALKNNDLMAPICRVRTFFCNLKNRKCVFLALTFKRKLEKYLFVSKLTSSSVQCTKWSNFDRPFKKHVLIYPFFPKPMHEYLIIFKIIQNTLKLN
jgi:hypothetical protein